jgi:hypothetical protein
MVRMDTGWKRLEAYTTSSWLGVHSAIDCQVRASDVRRFRTGDECHHRGDIVNMSIAVECGDGLLWHRPIAVGGVQIRIDGAGLDIIDRNASASYLSG